MALNFPADVLRQRAMEEQYNKETAAQLAFFRKQRGDETENSTSKQLEVLKRKIEMAPKMMNMDRVADGRAGQGPRVKVKVNPDDDLLRRVAALGEVDGRYEEMRPAAEETKKLLYDGISKEGKGKKQYLSSRYEKNPDEKFVYPILSSMEYGWKLDELVKTEDVKKPPFGRTRLINDTFYTRTGIPLKHQTAGTTN